MTSRKDDYRGGVLLAAAVVCTILSTISFFGRIWGRYLSRMRYGLEDALMALALVSRRSRRIPSEIPMLIFLAGLLVRQRHQYSWYASRNY